MSNEYPGDEPTRVHRPFDENDPTQVEPRRYHDEDNATRLEQSIPAYDETREPAANPYPVTETREDPGIAAQLVAVGLICILIGLGLGYFLFRGLDDGGSGDDTTTTTSSTTTTTESTTTTTEVATSTTARAAASTTTARPAATSTTAPRPTTTARPATTTTISVTTSTAADPG